MTTVLITEAERSIRNSLKERLEYERCVVDMAESSDEMLSKMSKTHFDLLLFDMTLLSKGVLSTFVKQIHEISTDTAIIVLSPVKSVEQAVECMRAGAMDYIVKPIDLGKLLASIKVIKASAGEKVDSKSASGSYTPPVSSSKTVAAAPKLVKKSSAEPDYMIGESAAMKHVKKLIEKVAATDSRVLIMGANGTGKELVARWLHEKSNRVGRSFVEVNCAAIPSELIESELFGHEKGSFTSAIRQRKGKFEQADGGTLFLDEIGDMSLAAQSKMLRALQENRISRIGSDMDIDVNVRVIAATNKDLTDEIKWKTFREDLYHRLSVIIIRVPSLAERRDDIPLLVNHFTENVCAQLGIPCKTVEPKCIDALQQMEWPGNIRQLRNVVERLIVLSEKSITLEDVELYAELK